MRGPLISFLIVNWNGGKDVLECVSSIYRNMEETPETAFEIILGDNHSTDGSLEAIKASFPQVRLITYRENFLFARPVNECAALSRAPFIFLLNNDATLAQGRVDTLLKEFEKDGRVGAVAPQLRYPDGTVQPSCRRFPSFRNLVLAGFGLERFFPGVSWKMAGFSHDEPALVDQPMMSALLISRECWEDVGPLDEKRFPLYFNDVDWCFRARKKGWKICFVPRFTVCHHEALSGKRLGLRQALYSARGLYAFFVKHRGIRPLSPGWFLLMLLCGGLLLRGVGGRIRGLLRI